MLTKNTVISQVGLSPNVRYAGTCLAIAACQSNNSAILIFGQNNVIGSAKSSVAAVLNVAGGAAAGIVGSTIYLARESPTYTTGLAITMALQAWLICMCLIAIFKLGRYNRSADRGDVVFHGVEGWRWTL